jgi:hypothetical protein
VDDIILFGKGYLDEWKVIKEALDLFSSATGMTFSSQKSRFLEGGLVVEELLLLKEFMPYEIKILEEGFKWNFFLNPTTTL